MQNSFNGFVFIFAGIGGVVFNVMNIWITDYKTIFFIQMISLSVWGIGTFALVESPPYLFRYRLYTKLHNSLNYLISYNIKGANATMAAAQERLDRNMNKLTHPEKEGKNASTDEEDNRKTRPIINLVYKLKVYLRMFAITIVIANLYIVEGILVLIPQEMGIDNIYLNGTLLGISEIFAYLALVFVAYKIKRRFLNVSICLIIILISLISLAIAAMGARQSVYGKLLETSLSLLLKIIVCMNFVLIFNYAAELFDMQHKGVALGIAIFVGRTAMGSGSLLIDFAHKYNVHPISTCIFSTMIALPLAFHLPETRDTSKKESSN